MEIYLAALDVEELGSVYESLLDYTHKVTIWDGIYHFPLVTGSDRKTTGSYYTPLLSLSGTAISQHLIRG